MCPPLTVNSHHVEGVAEGHIGGLDEVAAGGVDVAHHESLVEVPVAAVEVRRHL